jgi:hypothetical protein
LSIKGFLVVGEIEFEIQDMETEVKTAQIRAELFKRLKGSVKSIPSRFEISIERYVSEK